MNNEDRLRAESLKALNEKFKSAFIHIAPAESAATQAVKSSPSGLITSEALTLMQLALSPNRLRLLKSDINVWLENEMSYVDCEWDEVYMHRQKERLFSILSSSER